VTQSVLGNFLAVFKSEGFMVSGGVFPCFLDDEGFVCDVQRDLDEGLFGKTIIHPRQITLANELYKVDAKSYQEALEMVQSTRKVFNQNGSMAERLTMSPYAKTILRRYEVYGVASNGESCSL
jgi:citrate lyase beta subunit